MRRVLGLVEGNSGGPLIILVGGMHGNEVAGIKAINEVFRAIRLNRIPINGTLVGLAGNLQAIAKNRRFIDYDLNRCWKPEFIESVYHKQHTLAEDIELKTLHQHLLSYSDAGFAQKILVDLHTTSSEKGNFIIVSANEAGNSMVQSLKQPVVIDLDQHLTGTLLQYIQSHGFFSMAFEGGLIGSPQAIDLHIAGIWEILKSGGAIAPDANSSFVHLSKRLRRYSEKLPQLVRVRYHHKIKANHQFTMKPGFKNFQPVKQGQEVASDRDGSIYAPVAGLMFLPLYQSVGEDGFFIVEEVKKGSPVKYEQ